MWAEESRPVCTFTHCRREVGTITRLYQYDVSISVVILNARTEEIGVGKGFYVTDTGDLQTDNLTELLSFPFISVIHMYAGFYHIPQCNPVI